MKKVKLKLELQYNSPVILTFFLLSLLVLFLDQWTDGWTTMHLFCVYRSSLKDPLFYIRLFGHVLGHASWDHFLNNMLLLLVIGPPMEEKYGSISPVFSSVFAAFSFISRSVGETFKPAEVATAGKLLRLISAENAASAIGERQVFPVQTNTIFLIFCFAIFRFTLPRQNPPRLFFHFFNAARPPKRRLCADDSERPPLPRLFASVPRQSVRPPFFPPV